MHKLKIRRMFAEKLKAHLSTFQPDMEAQSEEDRAEITLQVSRVMGPISNKLESTINAPMKAEA